MAPQGCVYPNHEWKVRHCPHLFSDEERARLLARLDDQDREADHG